MKNCGCKKEMPQYMHEDCMMDDECMPMHQEHMMMKHGCHMMHDEHMMMKQGCHMMKKPCCHMMPMHMMPGMNKMMMTKMNMACFKMHSDPIIEYACMQVKKVGVKCAIMEAALLGLLIGMGHSHEEAHMVLDNWKMQ